MSWSLGPAQGPNCYCVGPTPGKEQSDGQAYVVQVERRHGLIYKESSIVVGGLLGTTSTPSSPEDEPSESEETETEGEAEKDES